MRSALLVIGVHLAAVLGGCVATLQAGTASPSACAQHGEASYACQVERYRNANE